MERSADKEVIPLPIGFWEVSWMGLEFFVFMASVRPSNQMNSAMELTNKSTFIDSID
jgi:hypothetical protein